MIILRESYFSNLKNEMLLDKLIKKLEDNNIFDYEIIDKIQKDVISISSDLNSVKIYLPSEFEYSQYEIDDYIRSIIPHIRINTIFDRGIYIMKLPIPITFEQYYKIIKYIITENDFCSIIEEK